jgi:hypothetical protein
VTCISSGAGRLACAALAAALAAPAAAQQKGLFFTSPLTLSATRENKFIVHDEALSDDVLFVALPTMSLLRLSPRSELSLSYQPELQAFATYRELTAVNHNAELVATRNLTPHLTVSAMDTFVSTSDSSRRTVDSVILLPRDRFTENDLQLEIARRFGESTTLNLRYNNTVTLVPDGTSPTGLYDREANAGSLSLARRFGRRHQLMGTVMYLDSRPLSAVAPRSFPTGVVLSIQADQAESGALTYMYQGDSFGLRLSGGLVYGTDLTYTGGGQLDKRFGRSTITLAAQRNLSFYGGVAAPATSRLGAGVYPFGLYETALVRLRLEISRRLAAQVQAAAQRTFTELTNFEVRSDFARVKLTYQVGRTLAVFGVTEAYRQSFNEFVGVPLGWQRFGAGIEVYASSKPSPLEERRRLREDRERRLRRGEAVEDESAAPATRGVSAESTR